ncbi:MAG: ribonuclease Z [Thermoplasmata archaeon]
MRAVFLGTGGTYPCTERNVTSIAVQMGKEVILLDCGEGTQRQLMQSTVSFMAIRWVFISHFHGDHFLGLPGLIQSMNLNDRKRPIDIFGPPGTMKLLSQILTSGYFAPSFQISLHDVEPGDAISFEAFKVIVGEADHTVPALCYSIVENDRPGKFNASKAEQLGVPRGPLFRKLQLGQSVKIGAKLVHPRDVVGAPRRGRKIVFSGDTRPCKAIIELSRNADLLIHDATLLSSEGDIARDFGHSTAREAAEVASEAKVRALALIHYSPRYKDASVLEEEAKKVFKSSFAPSDLDEYIIRVNE